VNVWAQELESLRKSVRRGRPFGCFSYPSSAWACTFSKLRFAVRSLLDVPPWRSRASRSCGPSFAEQGAELGSEGKQIAKRLGLESAYRPIGRPRKLSQRQAAGSP